jgi:hypothetical protein
VGDRSAPRISLKSRKLMNLKEEQAKKLSCDGRLNRRPIFRSKLALKIASRRARRNVNVLAPAFGVDGRPRV